MPLPPPPISPNSLTVTAQSLITSAMQEIGAISPGEQPSIEDSAWILQKLQRLIDRYNARQPMIYANTFTQFTLPVNLQPVTIGPGIDANFQVNQRPVDIETIGVIINTTTPAQVEIWVNKRDKDWWAQQRVKNLTSTLPTDFYYEPDWQSAAGLGNIFFWPIPTTTNNVLLQMRTVLTQITNYNQSFSLPPGYWDAIIYPLAVSLCPSFERQATPELIALAKDSLKTIEANNVKSPRGRTADAGMPGTEMRGDFNYYSGMPN